MARIDFSGAVFLSWDGTALAIGAYGNDGNGPVSGLTVCLLSKDELSSDCMRVFGVRVNHILYCNSRGYLKRN